MRKLALAFFWLLMTVSLACAQEPPPDSVPLNLAIAYYTKPENLVGLRRYMSQSGLAQFAKWRSDGVLKDYRALFASYVDSGVPAMYILLGFPNAAAALRWTEIEKTMPAGLTPDGLALVSSAETAQMDVAFHGQSPPASANSVFMVIPYEFYVTPGEYRQYMKDYGVPQFDGWLRENVILSYGVYVNRYSASKPWGSLIVFEYRDAESLGRREAVMAKVRAQLQSNPTWKSISENKHKIRSERQAFIGESLRLPRN